MLESLRGQWESFKGSTPGHRFQDRYRRRHGAGGRRRLSFSSLVTILAGMAVTLMGLFLVPAPGPGWAIVFFGLGILGSEFLFIARFMDRSELAARRQFKKGAQTWRSMSVTAKVLVSLLVVVTVAAGAYAMGYVAWRYLGF